MTTSTRFLRFFNPDYCASRPERPPYCYDESDPEYEELHDSIICSPCTAPWTWVDTLIVVGIPLLVLFLLLGFTPIATVWARLCCCVLDKYVMRINSTDPAHELFGRVSMSIKAKFQSEGGQQQQPTPQVTGGQTTLSGRHRTTLLPNFWTASDEIQDLKFREDGTLSGTRKTKDSKSNNLNGHWCSTENLFVWKETKPGVENMIVTMATGMHSTKGEVLYLKGDFCTGCGEKFLGKLSYKGRCIQ